MTPFDNQYSSTKLNLNEIYTKQDIYLYPYARYAFLELLSKLNIKSIYIPSFICRDMLSPLNNLKVKYFFYELDINLVPILEDIECDAILSVNYFGFDTNIDSFMNYKRKYNSIFIEDNAHGFLSKDLDGNLLGTRGDFGLLSIRKTVFLPNGAALLVNNDRYKKVQFETKESKVTFEDEKYKKKSTLKKLFISRYFGIAFLLFRRLIRYIKSGSAIPLPDKNSEMELPANSYVTPKLENMQISINIDVESNRRRIMYLQIFSWAKKFDIKAIYTLSDGAVPFEFAFIDNGSSKEFEKYLFLKGFFILPWPDLPEEIIIGAPKFYKNVKVVPFLW